MSKILKAAFSIFVGLDLAVLSFFLLAQLRYQLFGTNEVPGIGSAFDMAIFLLALFIGALAGTRLYYFLTYRERKVARLNQAQTAALLPKVDPAAEDGWELAAGSKRLMHASVWEDRGWDDEDQKVEK